MGGENVECIGLVDYETVISNIPKKQFRVIGDFLNELPSDSRCFFEVGDYEHYIQARAVTKLRQENNQQRFEEYCDPIIDFYIVDDNGKEIFSGIEGEIEEPEEEV